MVKLKFKNIFLAIILIGLIILIILKFQELKEIIRLLLKINPVYLTLAIIFQALTYLFTALSLKFILKIIKIKMKLLKLFKFSVTSTFLNIVVPSLGVSSLYFVANSFKKEENISEGKSFIVLIMNLIFTIVSFALLSSIGIFVLLRISKADFFYINTIIAVLSIIVLAIATLFLVIISNGPFRKVVLNLIFRLLKLINKSFDSKRLIILINEIKITVSIFLKNKNKFLLPFLFSLIKLLFDIVTLYIIFYSLNYKISLDILLVGYTLTNIIAILSFIPGGIGIFELSMSTIFAALAVPLPLAIASVLIYRAVSFWLLLPFGFWIYKKHSS